MQRPLSISMAKLLDVLQCSFLLYLSLPNILPTFRDSFGLLVPRWKYRGSIRLIHMLWPVVALSP